VLNARSNIHFLVSSMHNVEDWALWDGVYFTCLYPGRSVNLNRLSVAF